MAKDWDSGDDDDLGAELVLDDDDLGAELVLDEPPVREAAIEAPSWSTAPKTCAQCKATKMPAARVQMDRAAFYFCKADIPNITFWAATFSPSDYDHAEATSTPTVSFGSRVRILRGKHAGRAGVVVRTPEGTFRDHIYVLLDPRPRERTRKKEMVARADVEPEPEEDVVGRLAAQIVPAVAATTAYQNAALNTPHTARLEADRAVQKAMLRLLPSDVDAYRRFANDAAFRQCLQDEVFARVPREAPTR
jgi:hypothetical protein